MTPQSRASSANSGSGLTLFLQQLQDALDGDLHPLGTVVGLVAELVHGLAEQEGVEQDLGVGLRAGDEAGSLSDVEIGAEERSGRPRVPEAHPVLQHLGSRPVYRAA